MNNKTYIYSLLGCNLFFLAPRNYYRFVKDYCFTLLLVMVSVIMPCYNSEKFIVNSIESVLAQTMANWELIIVNDCSTDGTQAIIDNYARVDKRIKGIRLPINSKASGARNAGIDQATYDYIAFIDSDDMWVEEKLQTQLTIMEKEKLTFTFTSYFIIDSHENVNGKRLASGTISYQRLLQLGNDIGCSTVMYYKKAYENYRFNLSIPIHEDYKMWLDMLRHGNPAKGIRTALTLYRVHSGSKNLNKWNSFLWNWKIWRQYENQSVLKTTIISARWGFYKIVQRLFLQ